MPDAQLRRVSSGTVREVIAKGVLPELEYGLLKEHGQKLRWTTHEKARFCNMVIDVLELKSGGVNMEVQVRSFCHAANVTGDYLTLEERFATRQTILVIGDVGISPSPWASMIQPALYLHGRGFNIVCVEIPSLATSTPRWLKYGPAIVHEALALMKIRSVCTLACNNGGSIFLEAMGLKPTSFGSTHFVFNIDCPPGTKKAPFPVFKLEDTLRQGNMQYWFGYNDEEGGFNHFEPGTGRKSYDAVIGMQARLQGERRRGRRSLDFDEVLISEQLNQGKAKHVTSLRLGRNDVLIFSDEFLHALGEFFEHPPSQSQDDLTAQGGLIMDMKSLGANGAIEDIADLPALQELAMRSGSKVRTGSKAKNDAEEESNKALADSNQGASDKEKKEEVRPLIQLALDARERPLPQASHRYLQDREEFFGEADDRIDEEQE